MLDRDDPYWWTEDLPASTLTFVEGWSASDLAEALGGSVDGPPRPLSEVDASPEMSPEGRWLHRVQVGEQDGWAVLVEPNGFAGVYEPLVPLLSKGRRQVALYQSVNAVMTFLYAVDGVVTRRFDPLLHPEQQHGVPLPEEAGLVFGWVEEADDEAASASTQPDPFRQAVHLVERLTGGTLTSEWLLSTQRPVYRMPADPAKVQRG